jgi:hypothetical protein
MTNSPFLPTAEQLLRSPSTLMARIHGGREDLRPLPAQLAAISVIGFAAFGFLLGLTHSPLSGLLAAPKLVLVGLGSLAVCLPAFHVYGRLLGNDGTPLQVVCEALAALAATGLTLLALCPVWLAFARLTDTHPFGYFHLMAGCVAFLILAGLRGSLVLSRSLAKQKRKLAHLICWTLLYGLVGIQSAWVMRPFVGRPGPDEGTVVLRPLERSAFDAAVRLAESNVNSAVGYEAIKQRGLPGRHGDEER